MRTLVMALLVTLVAACGGAQTRGPEQDDEAARQALKGLHTQAADKQQPIVAIAHSDGVAAWHELDLRVLQTAEGKRLLDGTVVWRMDIDQPVGAAMAAQLRVVTVPTAVVLRPQGGRLVEMARVQGYQDPADWREKLADALERKQPHDLVCHNADDRELKPGASAEVTVPDVGCVATNLLTDQDQPAAAKLQALLGDPAFPTLGLDWPEAQRAHVGSLLLLTGPYYLRIRRDAATCTETLAKLRTWQGLPETLAAPAVQWHARCLARSGQAEAAVTALDGYVTARPKVPRAGGVAAEVLVQERLAPERARVLLEDLTRRDPDDADAWLLLAELERQAGHPKEALAALRQADRARPQHAMTLRRMEQVRGPAGTVERVE